MKIHFQYTAEDIREAHAEIRRQLRPPRFRRGLMAWMLFIAAAICLVVLVRNTRTNAPSPEPVAPPQQESFWLQTIVPLVPWLLIFGFVWFFVFRQLRGSARKAFDSNPAFHRPHWMEADDKGLTLAEPVVQTRLGWGAFTAYSETASLFLLYQGKRQANIIPKRAFPDQMSLDAFRLLLSAHIAGPSSTFPVLPTPLGGF